MKNATLTVTVRDIDSISDIEIESHLRYYKQLQSFQIRPEIPLYLQVFDGRPCVKSGRQTRIRRVERPDLCAYIVRIVDNVCRALDISPGAFERMHFEFPHAPIAETRIEVWHG